MASKKTIKKKSAAKAKKNKAQPHTHYHKDGALWAKGYLLNGVMAGYWEWFRKTGTKMRSGYFDDNGRQTGEWTTYDANGKVYKVTNMNPKKKNKT